MPTRLTGLVVDYVSLVDAGAHPGARVVLAKRVADVDVDTDARDGTGDELVLAKVDHDTTPTRSNEEKRTMPTPPQEPRAVRLTKMCRERAQRDGIAPEAALRLILTEDPELAQDWSSWIAAGGNPPVEHMAEMIQKDARSFEALVVSVVRSHARELISKGMASDAAYAQVLLDPYLGGAAAACARVGDLPIDEALWALADSHGSGFGAQVRKALGR